MSWLLVACGPPAPGASPPVEPGAGPISALVEEAAPIAERTRLERIEAHGIVVPAPLVCIPPEASDPERELPVLYALDGDAFLDALGLCEVVAELAADGRIEPWVVVGLPSTEERDDVLSQRHVELARIVAETIEPALAARVRLRPGPEHRAIVGFSYGGLAAARMALAAPESFGRVVAMSPSFWFRDRIALRELERAERLPVRVYLDAGGREGGPREVVPYAVADVRAFAAAAVERGLCYGDGIAFRVIADHPHDMRLARDRLPGALTFALGGVDRSGERPRAVTIAPLPAPEASRNVAFSVDATFGDGVVLSFPLDVADVRLDDRRIHGDRVARDDVARLQADLNGAVSH